MQLQEKLHTSRFWLIRSLSFSSYSRLAEDFAKKGYWYDSFWDRATRKFLSVYVVAFGVALSHHLLSRFEYVLNIRVSHYKRIYLQQAMSRACLTDKTQSVICV